MKMLNIIVLYVVREKEIPCIYLVNIMQHAWNVVKIYNNVLYVEIKFKNKLEYLKTENKKNKEIKIIHSIIYNKYIYYD